MDCHAVVRHERRLHSEQQDPTSEKGALKIGERRQGRGTRDGHAFDIGSEIESRSETNENRERHADRHTAIEHPVIRASSHGLPPRLRGGDCCHRQTSPTTREFHPTCTRDSAVDEKTGLPRNPSKF
jgi:hypothetical protein